MGAPAHCQGLWILLPAVAYNPRSLWRGSTVQQCKQCAVGEDDAYLHKCPICHKWTCDDHKIVRSGRVFCSVFCADFFFHDIDEDD